MRGNTITITMPLKRGKVAKTDKLFQYDYGQKLLFTGIELPTYYEVHFSNEMHGTAVTSIGDPTGVEIPDSLLATGDSVYLWLFLHDDVTDGETEFQGVIPVIKRAHVDDQITPEQRSVVEQAIVALNTVPGIATEQAVAAATEVAAEEASAWAIGTIDPEHPAYQNSAKDHAEEAAGSAEDAEDAKDAAEDAQAAAERAAGIALAQGGEMNFSINNNGDLILSYTDQVPIDRRTIRTLPFSFPRTEMEIAAHEAEHIGTFVFGLMEDYENVSIIQVNLVIPEESIQCFYEIGHIAGMKSIKVTAYNNSESSVTLEAEDIAGTVTYLE